MFAARRFPVPNGTVLSSRVSVSLQWLRLWWLITTEESNRLIRRLLTPPAFTTRLNPNQFKGTLVLISLSGSSLYLMRAVSGALTKVSRWLYALRNLVFTSTTSYRLFQIIIHLFWMPYKQKSDKVKTGQYAGRTRPAELAGRIEPICFNRHMCISPTVLLALCFGAGLSQQVKHPQFAWRRYSLQKLQNTWNWSAETIKNEDSRFLDGAIPQRQPVVAGTDPRILQTHFSTLQLFYQAIFWGSDLAKLNRGCSI